MTPEPLTWKDKLAIAGVSLVIAAAMVAALLTLVTELYEHALR